LAKAAQVINEDIKKGSFPKLIPIDARSVAWDSEAIDEWIEEKIKNAEGSKKL